MKISFNPSMPQTNNIAQSQNKHNSNISFQRRYYEAEGFQYFENEIEKKSRGIGKLIAMCLGSILLPVVGMSSFNLNATKTK